MYFVAKSNDHKSSSSRTLVKKLIIKKQILNHFDVLVCFFVKKDFLTNTRGRRCLYVR